MASLPLPPTPPVPPKLPTAEEFYDGIMGPLNADLTVEGLQNMRTQHTNENERPEQTATRVKQCDAAFQQYDEKAKGVLVTLWDAVKAYVRNLRGYKENVERVGEQRAVESIETQISTL
ncbi:MAG: hypothetical protein V1926_00210 [Candidatus Peregrinibacteria bacterium]